MSRIERNIRRWGESDVQFSYRPTYLQRSFLNARCVVLSAADVDTYQNHTPRR